MPYNSMDIKEDGRIYWATHTYSLMALIPKRKGRGFLKTPVGHHVNDLSKFISDVGFGCCGLDGYLNIETGPLFGFDIEHLIKELEQFYKTEAVEVSFSEILEWLIR